MIEVDPETRRGFAYGGSPAELAQRYSSCALTVERSEKVMGKVVHTLSVADVAHPSAPTDLTRLGKILCKHGRQLDYRSINRLPQEGWQELIDCWSCHDCEFKSMLDLKVAPREFGILTANFYLLAHPSALPECCRHTPRLYYNELRTGYSDRNYIYLFLDEYFQHKSALVVSKDGRCYEIKRFYKCVLLGPEPTCAIKVGIRDTEKADSGSGFTNEYFIDRLLEEVAETAVGITVLGYGVAFVRQR
ncbi:ubiquitin-protein ligase E3 D [Pancytospora philotis]|nr:ubiquitin-protein ligase E3 D [Pancytospora philotis]